MKKVVGIVLAVMLVCACFVGCGASQTQETQETPSSDVQETQETG